MGEGNKRLFKEKTHGRELLLSLQGGAAIPAAAPVTTASGATLNFGAGTYTLADGSQLSGGGTVTITGATVNVPTGTATITTALSFSSGTIGGSGTLTVSGPLTWTGGTMSGAGVTNAQGGLTIGVAGVSAQEFLSGRTLNNFAAATVAGVNNNNSYDLFLLSGGTFDNEAGASLSITTDTSILADGGTPSGGTLVNAGTLSKTGGTGTSVINVALTDTGTIQASSGVLSLQGGAAIPAAAPVTTASGATLNFGAGTYTLVDGSQLSGGGTVTITGATVNVPTGTATITTALSFSSGTIGGSGTLTVSGPLTWTGGTMSGAGVTNAQGGLTIGVAGVSDQEFLSGRTLNNFGSATVAGVNNNNSYDLFLLSGGTFDNEAGASLSITTDTSILADGGTPSGGTLVNAGTLSKTGGTSTSVINVALTDTGTIQASSGVLSLQGGAAIPAAAPVTTASGATLNFGAGTYTLVDGSQLSGGGTVTITGATVNVPTGTATITTALSFSSGTIGGSGTLTVSGPLTWTGGTMSGAGVTNAQGGLTIGVAGVSAQEFLSGRTLNNFAAATVAGVNNNNSYDLFLLSGGTFDNEAGASLSITTDTSILADGGTSSGGTLVNAGTLSKTGGTGTSVIGVALNSTGSVQSLSGTLSLQGGGTISSTAKLSASTGGTLDFHGGTYPIPAGASITGTGTGIISFSGATVTVNGTYSVAGTTTVSGGEVDFDTAAPTTALIQSSGTIGGTGTLTISGQTTWTGGTMSGTGVTNAEGGLTIGGAGALVQEFLSGRTLNNFASATVAAVNNSGNYGLYFVSGGTFDNEAGASLSITTDTSILADGGTPSGGTLVNAGTLSKTGGTGTSVISVVLTNTGSVQSSSGVLSLQGGGTISSTVALSAAPGGTLDFHAGTYTIPAGASISGTGPGTLSVSGATVAINGTFSASTLTQSSGTIGGSGTLTVSGPLTWTGGTMSGTGTTNAQGGLTLGSAASSAETLSGRTLNSFAAATLAGSFNNLVGSTFDVQTNGSIEPFAQGTSASFVNSGTLKKSAGAGTTGVGVAFNNASGTVEVDSGTLSLSGAITQASGTTLTGGTWNVFGGAALDFASGVNLTTNSGNITLSGAGSTFANIDNLATNGGSFTLTAGSDFTTAGALANSGKLTIGPSSVLTVSGNYSQSAAATLDMQLGGPPAASQFGQLMVSGSASLGGTLEADLEGGYIPVSGDSFTVGSYASHTATFSAFHLPSSSGVSFQSNVNGTNIILHASTVISLSSVPGNQTVQATGPSGAVVTYSSPTATDQVDPHPTVTSTPPSGSSFPLGTTTVTVTATDNAGNTASATFTVDVVDTTPPVLSNVPANQTVAATGPSGAVVTFASATATDLVDPNPTVTTSPPSGSTFPLGTTTVTVTAKDQSGNTTSATFTVDVVDTTPPVLSNVPANQTVAATGPSGAVVTYASASATDLVDPNPTVTSTLASGSTFPLGTTTVTVTAKDQAGNMASATFTIDVVDTTSPVLSNVPANQTVAATGPSGAVVTYASATATDVVDPNPTVTSTPASGSTFPLGTTTVTVTAKDQAGNMASATFTVDVVDTAAPVLSNVPANQTVNATGPSGALVTYATATATDPADPHPTVTSSPPSGSTFPLGTTTVTVTAKDQAGNTTSATFTIDVVDTTPPVLSNVPANQTVHATGPSGALVTYASATATDLIDPNPSVTSTPASGSTFPLGTTTVTVTAKDQAGNTTSATFTVDVVDTTPPVLSNVPANQTVQATGPSGAVVTYASAMATDPVDPHPTVSSTPPSGSTFPLGTTTVTVTATDQAGNRTSATFTIDVVDTAAPVLSNVPANQTVAATAPSGAVVTYTSATATDLVDPHPTVTSSPPSGSTFPLGTTTVTVTATDQAGNTTSSTFTIDVMDTTPPVLSNIPANQTVNTTNPSGAVVTYASATATDPFDPNPTVTSTPPSGWTFPLGTTTVTVTATDHAGNSTSATFTIDVADNPAPGGIQAPNPPVVPTQLVITTPPPGSVAVGAPFVVTVTAEDGAGDVATSFNAPVAVAVASDPGGVTLGGTLTATAVNGVATFSGLALNEAGSDYTLQLSGGGLSATTSGIAATGAGTPASHQFFSTAAEQTFVELSNAYVPRATVLTAIGTTIAPPLAAPIDELAAYNWDEALTYGAIANDPPASDFTTVAPLQDPTVPPVSPGPGITEVEADTFNALLSEQAQALGLAQAISTALNSAQAASASPADAAYAQMQLAAVTRFSQQLAVVDATEPDLDASLQAALAGSGVADVSVMPADIQALQAMVASSGLPAGLVNALQQLAASDSQLQDLQLQDIQGDLAGQNPATAAGSLYGTLTDPAFATLMQNATQTLMDTVLISGALSPASATGVSNTAGIHTNDSTPTLTGTAPPGTTVQVFAQSQVDSTPVLMGSAVTDASGHWQITTTHLADGSYSLTARISGGASGFSQVTPLTQVVVNTVAPQVVAVSYNRKTGMVTVTFNDPDGVNPASLANPANFLAHAGMGANSPALAISGFQCIGNQVTFTVAQGRSHPSAVYLNVLSGVQDLAGNALDGKFTGTLPSGNGQPGSNFVAKLPIPPHKAPKLRKAVHKFKP